MLAKSCSRSHGHPVPGVRNVVQVPSGIAVIADHFWAAKLGRDALAVEWDRGPNAALDSVALREHFRSLARTPGAVAAQAGVIVLVARAGVRPELGGVARRAWRRRRLLLRGATLRRGSLDCERGCHDARAKLHEVASSKGGWARARGVAVQFVFVVHGFHAVLLL